MLQINHLSHSFGTQWALKNISLHVDQGDFAFLTGPSGAGKTTLLRILHGSLPLQRGEAQIAGFDLKKIRSSSIPKLRRSVSVVFQDFKVLLDRSVQENVALPLHVGRMNTKIIQRRVGAVLRGLNLEKKANLKCVELSGGEQQRVAIARAVVVNPKILLADEPTGNLDEDLSYKLLEVFKQFNIHGTTILLATHSRRLIHSVDRAKVFSLKNGQLTNSKGQDVEDDF